MRGIVTLAAALALPDAFPYRDLIVLTAFAVVLGTLVVQGLTLRTLVMMLGLDDDSPVDNEVRAGRVEMFKAAIESVDNRDDDAAAALRREYTEVLATNRRLQRTLRAGASSQGRSSHRRQNCRARETERAEGFGCNRRSSVSATGSRTGSK